MHLCAFGIRAESSHLSYAFRQDWVDSSGDQGIHPSFKLKHLSFPPVSFHPVVVQQPAVLCTHAPALGPARLLPGFCIWCCFLIARYLFPLYSAVACDQRPGPHSSQACLYQMDFPCVFITCFHRGKESCRCGSTWLWISGHLKTRPHHLILETCSFRAGFFHFSALLLHIPKQEWSWKQIWWLRKPG